MICVTPVLIQNQGIHIKLDGLKNQGISIPATIDLAGNTLEPGDRIIRINGCRIEDHITAKCQDSRGASSVSYEIIRNNQLSAVETTGSAPLWGMIRANFPAITGAVIMLGCALITLLNIEKVRWYPVMLAIFLLFVFSFLFEAVKLPLLLVTIPFAFWAYQIAYILIQTILRAYTLNLILQYPQHRFKKKRTRQIILGSSIALPSIVFLFIFFSASNTVTGIQELHEALRLFAVLMLGFISFTWVYHVRKAKEPITNLRLRWIRIGVIALIIPIASFLVFLFAVPSTGVWRQLSFTSKELLIYLTHPFTLLLVIAPLLYAIPLAERTPRRIDNLENRVLFYLLLSAILSGIYAIFVLLIYQFDLKRIFEDPFIYVGYALSLAVMLILALLRSSIDRLINRWFYKDRLRYQTQLPGFILELSANLNQAQLKHLLLQKMPEYFELTGTELVLREQNGTQYSLITEEEQKTTFFSKNHPLIQHFQTTRKPVLRYLDQRMLPPGFIAVMEKMEMEAAIPLIHLGNLIGILFLGAKKNKKPFSVSELNVLRDLDDWVGTAIYNAWLISEKEDYSRTLEMEMEQQSRELDRVVDETRKYQRTSQQRNLQKEAMIGQVHEGLRKPLNQIALLTGIFSQNDNIDQEEVTELKHETVLLASRLDTFLDYSAIQMSKPMPTPEPYNLGQLFQQVTANLTEKSPAVSESIGFYLDANTPMVVNIDPARISQILELLIEITLSIYTGEAFVVTCGIEEQVPQEAPITLSFLCKQHSDAIVLHETEVAVDQIELKLELIHQLLERMNGELRSDPLAGDSDVPFHFSLTVTVPPDSYPVYLGVDLPFLNNRSLVIYDQDQYPLKQMALQTSSWGMQVEAVRTYKELLEVIERAKPALVLINKKNEDPMETMQQTLPQSVRTIIYDAPKAEEEMESEEPKAIQPQRLYSLISKALLFSTTVEQFPHLPRQLKLEPHSIAEGKQVLIIGEDETATHLQHYLQRFNLQTTSYPGKLAQLPEYLEHHQAEILLFELATKKQEEFAVLDQIRQRQIQQPFIITVSANPIRFPVLETLKAGADKYLLKPYQLEELLLMIADWLNHATEIDSSWNRDN